MESPSRRYAWFESFSTGPFVTVRYSQHGTGSGWTAGGLMSSSGSSPVTPGRSTGPETGAAAMVERACLGAHTRATQVRLFTKINTPVTRTRRHSPAHGDTIARIDLQAK